jgi:16S rRNA (guanine527-N7)-methyltransferase
VHNEVAELEQGVRELGCDISPQQSAALVQYLAILEETNRSFNLTRIPRADFVKLHLLDSLMALRVIPKQPNLRILDIGTGAGFPGVPLAALLPDSRVTLLDSTAKKVRFAAETAARCGIENCVGVHARAEELAKDSQHRGRYDVVVSRAVASCDALSTLMLPFVKKGGIAVMLKGAKVHDELKGTESQIRKLGGAPPSITTLPLPGTEIERHLVVIQKSQRT